MDTPHGTHEELLAAEAASWLQRLKSAGSKEQMEFGRWLRQSPAHVREALLASSWEVVLNHFGSLHKMDAQKFIDACSQNVVPVRNARAWGVRRRFFMSRGSRVAAMAVSLAVGAALVLGGLPFLRETLRHEYVTAIGEQRTLALEDGSVVSLNARSSIRVDFSKAARDLYLTEGQALFSVAHEATRPFRVHVKDSIVQAIGTKFDVRRLRDRIDVAVFEGQVRVATLRKDSRERPLEGAQLGEGEALSISRTGKLSAPSHINVAEVGAWRQRRLVFRDRPLSEIVEEFQRYNRKPRIRIEGEELRRRTFNGVFDADNPGMLIQYLATDDTLVFERQDGDYVVRKRSRAH